MVAIPVRMRGEKGRLNKNSGEEFEFIFQAKTAELQESPDFIDKTHCKKFSKNSCG